ncbi:hypothetical protein [Acaricomes phytoseiuli]|uniref:hypothetical protein n=1 Tax=Acaricomes phytoseiuli TaxID=291968 RepID=UPI0012E998D5|nr:hypothetical protein [Acaricomes phytoseiuli]
MDQDRVSVSAWKPRSEEWGFPQGEGNSLGLIDRCVVSDDRKRLECQTPESRYFLEPGNQGGLRFSPVVHVDGFAQPDKHRSGSGRLVVDNVHRWNEIGQTDKVGASSITAGMETVVDHGFERLADVGKAPSTPRGEQGFTELVIRNDTGRELLSGDGWVGFTAPITTRFVAPENGEIAIERSWGGTKFGLGFKESRDRLRHCVVYNEGRLMSCQLPWGTEFPRSGNDEETFRIRPRIDLEKNAAIFERSGRGAVFINDKRNYRASSPYEINELYASGQLRSYMSRALRQDDPWKTN